MFVLCVCVREGKKKKARADGDIGYTGLEGEEKETYIMHVTFVCILRGRGRGLFVCRRDD